MRNRTLRKRRNWALLNAVLMDDVPLVRSLLEEGADANARDAEHGETALILARSDQMRRLLLDHGADVTAHDDWGRTAFMASRDSLLLQEGIDINAQDYVGETALMKAITAAQFDRVEWLLANGANAHLRDVYGESALDRARERLIFALAGTLKRASTRSDTGR